MPDQTINTGSTEKWSLFCFQH